MSPTSESRARGALTGLALGDALGMPTQTLQRETIRERWGSVLTDFHDGPPENEVSAGMSAGTVTDDTDQAMILGRLLVAGRGEVDQQLYADELLVWQEMMRTAGSHDLLGPSTVRALTLIASGTDPERTGRWGDTNGAAMRITPVGIATPPRPLDALVTRVHRAGRVTHNTRIAVAGAAAVAAAVSTALEGADLAEATDLAIEAAHLGGELGHHTGGADVAARISWALDVVREHALDPGLDQIVDLVGTGLVTQESVPAAFAVLALSPDDPWLAVRAAASLGGDSDTIAAMTGAIAGAVHGVEAFPADAVDLLERVNPGLIASIADLVADLLALRASQA